MRTLETAILAELRIVADNKKLRLKDIMEWKTGRALKARDGELLAYLPDLRISVAFKSREGARPSAGPF